MKIFFIDKYNTFGKLINYLSENGFENIEKREDLKFRMTKNDYILISDDNQIDGLEKQKNIIMLTQNKEYKHIWKLATEYKTLDIIDANMTNEYILNRIKRLVVNEK